MKVEEPIEEIIKQLYSAKHQIILDDTFNTLKTFDDQKFDLVITSPLTMLERSMRLNNPLKNTLSNKKK